MLTATLVQKQDLYSVCEDSRFVSFFNDAKTEISITIKGINLTNRMASIVLTASQTIGKIPYLYTFDMDVRITKSIYYWLTAVRNVKDESGQYTVEQTTGYQAYLKSLNLPASLLIVDMKFNDVNHSKEYYKNPFRLTVSKAYKSATLYGVREFHYTPLTTHDPITGQDKKIWYQPKDKSTGKKLQLTGKDYKRLEIR